MRGRFMYLAAAVVAVAGVLLLAGPAGASRQVHATAATNVHCGDTINASVTMNGDLDCSAYSGTALTIATDGVTLDLGGHTITGNASDDVIYSDDQANNFTVQNGTISGGDEQIYIEDTNGAIFQNLTMNNAADDCIDTDNDSGTVISGNTCTGAADYGLYSEYSAGTMVTGNVFSNDDDGVYLDYGDNADVFSSNYIRANSGDGVDDYYSDMNTYQGNIVTGNIGDGFYMESDYYNGSYYQYTGGVTMVNNASRVNQDDGWDTESMFRDDTTGVHGPASTFSGNIANYNVIGFDEDYSIGATWSNNYAARNSEEGFYFDYPENETITNNTAKQNGSDGFYFYENYVPYDTASVTNNSATYNAGYGFDADYAVAGSGNSGGGSNSSGDCYLVSGCS